MSMLGVYFGPQVISVVELSGRKVMKNFLVNRSAIAPAGSAEEKVPEEVKLVTLLRDELRARKIDAKEAVFTLSGKDLIIRTFDMPIMPRTELEAAVSFEVKKYIPFKIEELTFDFQWKIDKSIKRIRVLFVGIKRETLDKYFYIINQLSLKVRAVEYSAFSILRTMKIAKAAQKGIIAIINTDLKSDDEGNFVVLEEDFPLFSRDITVVSAGAAGEPKKEEDKEETLNRLKREIKVSLDYYERKFPFNNITKIFFITEEACYAELNAIAKEMALPAQFVDIQKYISAQYALLSLPFLKAYSAALESISIALKINLLLAKEKAAQKIAAQQPQAEVPLFARLRSQLPFAAACIAVCFAVFLFGTYRALPLKNELKKVIEARPSVRNISPEASYEELTALDADYKNKVDTIKSLLTKQIYVTELLDAIPRIISKGMQLTNLSFDKQEAQSQLTITGNIYLADSAQERERVNSFLENLKKNPVFNKYKADISLDSIDRPAKDKGTQTSFVISCRFPSKGGK